MKKIIEVIIAFFKDMPPLRAFRLFAAILVLDIISLMALGSINPLSLLNPLGFFFMEDKDERAELTLVFPRSYVSGVTDIAEKQTLEVRQKVYWKSKSPEGRVQSVILALLAGPDSHAARPFLEDSTIVRKFWLNGDELVLSLASDSWLALPEETRRLAVYCFENSLKKNIPEIRTVVFTPESI